MRNQKILLVLIILVAAFLRLWQIGVVPPSPDWDEAALGYNAYSILQTGRDEYGTFLPLSLRSFDDYKPPLYVYLTVPSVALFGLETWAVRLPSAIFGILAVVGTYFLTKQIFKERKGESGKGKERQALYASRLPAQAGLPLLASLLLALSPWHIQFSRIAFEANIGVTLNIWAVVFFFKALTRRIYLPFSAFLFGLGLYAYHSERIFVPLLVCLLAIIFRKELLSIQRKALVVSILVGLLTIAPLVPVFTDATTLTRLRGTSVLSDQTGLLARSVAKLEDDQKNGDFLGLIFENRRIVWARTLLDGYMSHFSLKWLFLNGDNPRHHAPDVGMLYLFELPFLFWGMYHVAKSGGKLSRVLFGWFLLAPLAASPTTELPHAIRTLVFLPVFQIFTAFGILQFFGKALRVLTLSEAEGKRKVGVVLFPYVFLTFIFSLYALNVLYYLHMYFGHMNEEVSKSWQYGYNEAVKYAEAHKQKYKKIIVSTKLEQPHMFFLFFARYDPRRYLANGGTRSGGFAETTNSFDVYEFRKIYWQNEVRDGSILYIGTPDEIGSAGLQSIRYVDGVEAIRIADF